MCQYYKNIKGAFTPVSGNDLQLTLRLYKENFTTFNAKKKKITTAAQIVPKRSKSYCYYVTSAL